MIVFIVVIGKNKNNGYMCELFIYRNDPCPIIEQETSIKIKKTPILTEILKIVPTCYPYFLISEVPLFAASTGSERQTAFWKRWITANKCFLNYQTHFAFSIHYMNVNGGYYLICYHYLTHGSESRLNNSAFIRWQKNNYVFVYTVVNWNKCQYEGICVSYSHILTLYVQLLSRRRLFKKKRIFHYNTEDCPNSRSVFCSSEVPLLAESRKWDTNGILVMLDYSEEI